MLRLAIALASASTLACTGLLWPAAGLAWTSHTIDCFSPAPGTESAINRICPMQEQLAAFQLGRQWGYLNATGVVAIEPRFAEAGRFSEGLAPVQQGENGPWGYIDAQGRWVIEPQFMFADAFHEGRALVHASGPGKGYAGYIDRQGQWVAKPDYSDAGPMVGGRALARIPDGPQVFITHAGQEQALPALPADAPAGTTMRISGARAEPQRWFAEFSLPDFWLSPSGQRVPVTPDLDIQRPASPHAVVAQLRHENYAQRHWGIWSAEGRWLAQPVYTTIGEFQQGVAIAGLKVPGPAPAQAAAATAASQIDHPAPPPPPAPPGLICDGAHCSVDRQVLLDASGRRLSDGSHRRITRLGLFYLAVRESAAAELLDAQGRPLARLACDDQGRGRAVETVYGLPESSGWSAVNGCDGRHWISSPSGQHWSGQGRIQRAWADARHLTLLTEPATQAATASASTDREPQWQIFSQDGQALLGVDMLRQLEGRLQEVQLLEEAPEGAATQRPPIILSTRGDDYRERFYLITRTGRLVHEPQWRSLRFQRTGLDGAAPALWPLVLVRTADGDGALDVNGAYLVRPAPDQVVFDLSNGWLATTPVRPTPKARPFWLGPQTEELQEPPRYTLVGSQGQRIAELPGFDHSAPSIRVAPGLLWLQTASGWFAVNAADPHAATARPLPELGQLDGLASTVHDGHVRFTRPVAGEEGFSDFAIFAADGRRTSDWLRLEAIGPMLDGQQRLQGWQAFYRTPAGHRHLALLAPDGTQRSGIMAGDLEPPRGDSSWLRLSSQGLHGLVDLHGRTTLPVAFERIETRDDGWVKVSSGTRHALLDARNRWLTPLLAVRDENLFRKWADSDALVLGWISGQQFTAVDINGRVLQMAPATFTAHAPGGPGPAPGSPWQVLQHASPLPLAEQTPIDDAAPDNWLPVPHAGSERSAIFVDMQGRERLQLADWLSPSEGFQHGVLALPRAEGTALYDAQGRPITGAGLQPGDTVRVLGSGQLVVARQTPLPPGHPLARPAARRAIGQEVATAPAADQAAMLPQYGFVSLGGQPAAAPRFDAVAKDFQDGLIAVSAMGNLGLAQADGTLLMHSAWRCGQTPVVLDRHGEISWPADLRGQARAACPRP
ncbi:WG repeat-containing protein [Corticibacter populi]|nr:WG repeat-containing protein [Corticibacter populi]